jgi:hypothetical protein
MFSMIFFGFVFVVLLAGLVAVMLRRKKSFKKRASLEGNRPAERNTNMPRTSGFNKPSADDINEVVVPADNKLSQRGSNDQEQSNEEGSPTDRS